MDSARPQSPDPGFSSCQTSAAGSAAGRLLAALVNPYLRHDDALVQRHVADGAVLVLIVVPPACRLEALKRFARAARRVFEGAE